MAPRRKRDSTTTASQLSLGFDNSSARDHSALNELYADSARYRRSAEYFELMKFIGKFPRYSPYNCMLLHIQNPQATYVATPKQWQTRFHRTVKRDARPLLILAPNCPILFVYDLADTEGGQLPLSLENPFGVLGNSFNQLWWNNAINNAEKDGIYIDSTGRLSSLHAGTAYRLRSSNRILKENLDEPFDYLVIINDKHDLPTQYSTLAHELGHIYSGHLGNRQDDWWSDRRAIDPSIAEIEAESISYLVCERRRMKTQSKKYLSRFVGDDYEIPQVNLETILSVTYHVERMSAGVLPPRKPRRNIAANTR